MTDNNLTGLFGTLVVGGIALGGLALMGNMVENISNPRPRKRQPLRNPFDVFETPRKKSKQRSYDILDWGY